MKSILSLMMLFSFGAQAADLPINQLPSPTLSASTKMDSENLLIIRDSGLGLVFGTVVGLGFVAMSPGGFSNQNPTLQSEALMSGVVVGLAGGILAGLWQVKRNRMLKIMATPGDFKTQPASLNTTLTF